MPTTMRGKLAAIAAGVFSPSSRWCARLAFPFRILRWDRTATVPAASARSFERPPLLVRMLAQSRCAAAAEAGSLLDATCTGGMAGPYPCVTST